MTRPTLVLWTLLACALPVAHAADSSATERLMRVADCIRDAGDLKGAPREAFMNKCLGNEAGLVAGSQTKKTAPAVEPVMPAVPVTPVAAPVSDGLPPQGRILGCASASKGMQGEARAAYLKACLSGRVPTPVSATEQNKRRAACDSQASGQPGEERQAFIAACMNGEPVAALGAQQQSSVPAPHDDGEPRRRAACNVTARDKQGVERKAYIEQCIAARPAAGAAVASEPAASAPRSARERLVRSKACADEAHAQTLAGAQIMNFMNACMARP